MARRCWRAKWLWRPVSAGATSRCPVPIRPEHEENDANLSNDSQKTALSPAAGVAKKAVGPARREMRGPAPIRRRLRPSLAADAATEYRAQDAGGNYDDHQSKEDMQQTPGVSMSGGVSILPGGFVTWGARSLSPADRIRRKMPAAATRLAKYKRTTGNFRVKSGGMRATRESFRAREKGAACTVTVSHRSLYVAPFRAADVPQSALLACGYVQCLLCSSREAGGLTGASSLPGETATTARIPIASPQ